MEYLLPKIGIERCSGLYGLHPALASSRAIENHYIVVALADETLWPERNLPLLGVWRYRSTYMNMFWVCGKFSLDFWMTEVSCHDESVICFDFLKLALATLFLQNVEFDLLQQIVVYDSGLSRNLAFISSFRNFYL